MYKEYCLGVVIHYLFQTLSNTFKTILLNTAPTCGTEEPLLSGVNPVPDAYFTASSVWYSPKNDPYKARLNSGSAWSPSDAYWGAPEPNFYLQVSLGTLI